MNTESLSLIKSITPHTSQIISLLLLKDNRIASCSYDSTIKIYDPSNDYHCDITITSHRLAVFSLCQLDNSELVSCSDDLSIKIFSLTKDSYTLIRSYDKAHSKTASKLISLSNNRYASASYDATIKIWSQSPYQDTPLTMLQCEKEVFSIIEMKHKDLLISGGFDRMLRIWDLKSYQCISVVKETQCFSRNSLYQIDSERVAVGEDCKITIVNIPKCMIETQIENKTFGYLSSIIKLNEDIILYGCYNGKYLTSSCAQNPKIFFIILFYYYLILNFIILNINIILEYFFIYNYFELLSSNYCNELYKLILHYLIFFYIFFLFSQNYATYCWYDIYYIISLG